MTGSRKLSRLPSPRSSRTDVTMLRSGHGAPLNPGTMLYDISPAKIWAFVRGQPASYWFIVLYLFFEYVRPQSIYSAIYGWPFAFWSIALAAGSLVVEKGRKLRPWTPADTMLAVFTVIVLLSSILAVTPRASFNNLSDYLNWVLIYFLITTIVNTERRFLVFMLAFLVYCTKMSQHGFRAWIASGFSPSSYGVGCAPGFFQNSGECGIQMSMFFPIALFFVIALKPYWGRGKFWLFVFMPASAAISMVSSSSRGALVGLAAVLVWLTARNPKNLRALVGAALVAGVVWVLVPEAQKDRLSQMGEDPTSLTRLRYWADAREIMKEYPVLGIGYANWYTYYRRRYNAAGQLVHNVFYQAGAELGFIGLGAFIGLILVTFHTNRKTRRMARQLPDGGRFAGSMASGFDGALIGFMVTGYFVTVLYYPFFWINLAMTVALHCSTLHELKLRRAACTSASVRSTVPVRAPA
jgi:putative inorganic carbon (hco3(-)) transporter